MPLSRRDLLLASGGLAAAMAIGTQRSTGTTVNQAMPQLERLLTPESKAYETALAGLHNGTAAAQDPALIAQPRSEAEVVEAIQLARRRGLAISVCSGSHSALCSRNGTLMLDLTAGLHRIDPDGDRVTLQGGALMGGLLQALAPTGRMVPVGTHATPGFGLLTMGGIGHLSRSLGLTVDHIEALRGVTAQGEPFVIAAGDNDQELWKLLRGAAIFLAVITQATLRTDQRQRLLVVRRLHPMPELGDVLAAAEALPQQGSCSLILGFAPTEPQASQAPPQILSYAVAAEADREVLDNFQRQAGIWTAVAGGLEELPGFELPGPDGSIPKATTPSGMRQQRLRTKVYSINLPRGLGSSLVDVLTQALDKAPNRDCRIDLQHVGGVVNQIPSHQTAYRGRDAEWSVVVTAVWSPSDGAGEAKACGWADDCFLALAPLANHYYIVQRHPGTPVYRRELELAYGELLDTLQRRKRQMDPDGRLASLS